MRPPVTWMKFLVLLMRLITEIFVSIFMFIIASRLLMDMTMLVWSLLTRCYLLLQ